MDRIVLEVDDSVGKFYRNFSSEGRSKFNQVVSLMIKKSMNDASFAEHNKLLDEISKEAIKNGLTAEILETLLSKDD